jgi:hypothetical protein
LTEDFAMFRSKMEECWQKKIFPSSKAKNDVGEVLIPL